MDTQSPRRFPIPDVPRLRPVDAFPIEHQGQEGYCLQDPQRIAKNTLVLPPAAFLIVSFMDGNHTIDAIIDKCTQQFQQEIPKEHIVELVERLDRELFLDSEQFQEALAQLENDYFAQPLRPAFHAGAAYEGEPAELQNRLDTLLSGIGEPEDTPPQDKTLTGLVSPHIDMHRGGPGFAYAYREIQQQNPADLYVIFGTGHQCRHSLMAPTRKSYDTPLGAVETDLAFIESFAKQTKLDLFNEEFLHRDEHSIEFQAVWLRHILGSDWQGKIVPILTGSLHQFIQEGRSPRSEAVVADALDCLRQLVDEYSGNVVVIAGADMSHVGKRFGHEEGIPDHELERVANEDGEILDAMRSGDAEQFFSSIEQQKDRNNVCGLSPVYMTMDITRPTCGQVLDYDRAIEDDTESVVTYSSVSFYR